MSESEFLLHMVESAHNGIMAVNREGIIQVFNRAARQILGLGDTSPVGRHHAEVAPDIWPDLKSIMDSGVARLGQQIQIRDRVILANRTPVRSRGEVIGIVSVFSDLEEAERILTELEAHRRLTQELEAIIEGSYDGIYVTDGKANTLRVNRAYERISGFRREELVGRTMDELVEAGYLDRSVSLEVLRGGEPVTIMQDIRGGKQVMATGTPFTNPETGEIELVVTNVRDITELNNLRSQLQRLKATTRFYSGELERLKALKEVSMTVVARSPGMQSVLDVAVRVAQFQTTVLITGETGVGKGLLARLVHEVSPRKDRPFLKINCGSIPAALLESELFGYEPGAFTGASVKGKPGLFEVAHEGTVFLDEIVELPTELQVKLLHILEDRSFTRVGGTEKHSVDIRVIAATNQDLEQAVRDRKFREDLYYRLKVVPIELPPLRQRREDILPLATHFLQRFNHTHGKAVRLGPGVADRLMEYGFPGNVRELENMVEHMVVMATGEEVSAEGLPDLLGEGRRPGRPLTLDRPLPQLLAELERRVLEEGLARWRSTYRMARHLGVNQSTIVRKLKKHGLASDAVSHHKMP